MSQDNPVPSIDNLKPPKDKCNSYLDGWYSALEAVKNILENGVETNKVQPMSAAEIVRNWNKPKCTCKRHKCRCDANQNPNRTATS